MHQINSKELDLNLLIILKVLLEEKNVTKASQRLHLSQSATSHALKRLRKMFNDPLLERSPSGMIPTPRALVLRESLENILIDIEELVKEPLFVPELAQGTIRMATSDYGTTVILPPVLKELSQKSPDLKVECYELRSDTLEKLRNREIDLLLGVLAPDDTQEFRSQNLFTERFVSIVRANHPILDKKISIESYIAWPHALITIKGSPILSIKKSTKSPVDSLLEELGVQRRVMLKLPHFLSAALIISQTDLILTLPYRIASVFAHIAKVIIFEPPINLGEYQYMQIWSKRCDHIPLQIWLRNLIKTESQKI